MKRRGGTQRLWDAKYRQGRIDSALGTGLVKLRALFGKTFDEFVSAAKSEAPPADYPRFEREWLPIRDQFEAQLMEIGKELISYRKFVTALGPRTINAPGDALHGFKECRLCRTNWLPEHPQAHTSSCEYDKLRKEMGWS